MNTIQSIYDFLTAKGWLHLDDAEEQIRFLAAGEYNENYHITVQEIYGEANYVFRINHGSQLGLEDQIEYEFSVLHALARSKATPRPFYCEVNVTDTALGNGVLLMEYLPGRPLDYTTDLAEAAALFAKVHEQPIDNRLIVQANPLLDIANESDQLLRRYPDHPMKETGNRLFRYHEQIQNLADESSFLFQDDPMVIVNTEVNSRNFIILEQDDHKQGWLVDWEKAVVSSRFQDLGHFLVPTTTLWKTQYRFDSEARELFLKDYAQGAKLDMDMKTILHCTEIMERTILLRALSWCYMAHYEYTHSNRALKNEATFKTIGQYLDGIECFLKSKN